MLLQIPEKKEKKEKKINKMRIENSEDK